MATPEITERLRRLTKNEVKVLYWHCLDNTEQEITDKINSADGTTLDIATIRSRKTDIYRKLEISSTGTKEDKRSAFQPYCRTLHEVAPQYSDLEDWPIILEKASIGPLVSEPKPEPEPEPETEEEKPPRPEWWHILIFIGVALGLYFVFRTYIFPPQTIEETPLPPGPQIVFTETSTSNSTETPTDTVTAPREEHVPGEIEPSPTNTFTLVPSTYTPTITPVPTDTPIPTDTLIPTPTPVVLFEDNFESGPSPEWDIPEGQLGQLFFVEGTVTATGVVAMYVGNTDWKNYEVVFVANIVDIDGVGSEPHEPTMVLVRVVDARNMIALRIWKSDIEWIIIENGQTTSVPNTLFLRTSEESRVSVVVTDDTYGFTFNGEEGPSFFTDKFSNGRVGMSIYTGTTVDNFKVVEMP